jgi:hypothetical protein
MADYRQIHTKIWKDGWFLDLSTNDKLLFIYLFSNERAHLTGLYDIPLKVIVFESGLSQEDVEDGLARFEAAGKAFYQNGWLWIPNLMRYNARNIESPRIQPHIKNHITEVPECSLKQRWIEYYNCMVAEEYRIHTVYIPNLHEHEHEHEHEHMGASAPPNDLPLCLDGWLNFIQDGKGNKGGMPARLRVMFETLYPGRSPPSYGRIGAGAKRVGGAARFAQLLWMSSGYNLMSEGDEMVSYIEALHKGIGKGDGKDHVATARSAINEWLDEQEAPHDGPG